MHASMKYQYAYMHTQKRKRKIVSKNRSIKKLRKSLSTSQTLSTTKSMEKHVCMCQVKFTQISFYIDFVIHHEKRAKMNPKCKLNTLLDILVYIILAC